MQLSRVMPKLPRDNTFDAYTIAFGLRNVTHIDAALAEAPRAAAGRSIPVSRV